jgi:hypothetical protein
LPDNADISNINSNSETLTIHYTIKGKNFIGIFSIKNGENIKKFSIN